MFVSTANCFRAVLSKTKEDEVRGKVYSFATGQTVSLDRDLGPGWKQVAAVREGKLLKLYVDGKLIASSETNDSPITAANDAPLRIGFGPHSHFRGKLREVRLYDRALTNEEVAGLKN
jgi:hypothetical protein